MSDNTDYLEVDSPIGGQNFVCLSFVSPEKTLKQKEVFMFNKYMSQVCGEVEKKLEDIMEKASDTFKNKIRNGIRDELRYHMKYTYDQFNSKFEDFKYKFNDELSKQFDKQCKFQTNVRGVKVRGVYSTYEEAEKRAKTLQARDRSFHVFVGSVGYWLPWDPCADYVENEEYLEQELNTLMKEYKENEIRKDLFYEEQKREAQQDAMKKKMEAERKQLEEGGDEGEDAGAGLEDEDPWMKAKFSEAPAPASTQETTEDAPTEDAPQQKDV